MVFHRTPLYSVYLGVTETRNLLGSSGMSITLPQALFDAFLLCFFLHVGSTFFSLNLLLL